MIAAAVLRPWGLSCNVVTCLCSAETSGALIIHMLGPEIDLV